MEKGPIIRSLFDHGGCYLYHHAKGFSGAKVSLSFLAGSFFESVDKQGLAHLVEHLVFKEVISKNINFLESHGAELNAYTYKETICFEMECHSDNLKILLPVFLDQFTKLDFSKEQFVKEKKVIIHELKEDEDDHETQGVEELFERNFDFSIGHQVGGKISSVKKFTTENVQSYFKKYFRSERAVLTIVSGKNNDFNPIVSKKFQNLKRAKTKKDPFRLKLYKKAKPLTHFQKNKVKKMESGINFFSFNGPKVNDTDYYDYLILNEILFEGISSVFFKKLREDKPLVYGMGSSVNSFHRAGQYMMIFSGSANTSKQIKLIVLETLNELKSKLIDEKTIQQIKTKMIQNWEISFDDLHERADFLTDQEVYGLSFKTLAEMRSELNKVNSESIQKVLNKILPTDDKNSKSFSYLLYNKRG